MRQWRARDPVTRFQRWLIDQGWWDDAQDTAARQEARRCGGGAPERAGAGLLAPQTPAPALLPLLAVGAAARTPRMPRCAPLAKDP